ncbi:MAG: arylsulfatase [Flammeovirgaceae bacterium]|jgi:arylsulfatase A-like enzyme|nr:arylsulfatase [Flammeovirgaceae bacterium]
MKNLFIFIIVGLAACSQKQNEENPPQRPNVLLIVADDLGFSDIGPFGGNIHTPVLDQFSKQGMLFSNFYVLPTCSPTRSALLTGNDNHVAGVGIMSEVKYPAVANLPGYSGHLNDQVVTLPEILREHGYHTYMAGKWHLGDDEGQIPSDRGFEESFTLLQGGGSHYADQKPLSPPQVMDYRVNGKKVPLLPADFYSTKNYTDTLIHYIDKNKGDERPFFVYASYTAPHDPLQAPQEYIEKYKGKFDMGWDSLRTLRLTNLKTLGIISAEVNSFAPSGIPQWSTLSAEEKVEFARDMEVYAAMIEYLDMSIGRLLDYLKQQGLYDNTLIVFMSDNGANGVMATTYPGNGDGKYLGAFNNELDNRGLPNSFIEMGPGWAQASSSPFRLFKSFASEGGIKAPLMIKPPNDTLSHGQWNRSFLHVTDLMPTILQLAEATYPTKFKDKTVRQPIGKSLLPVLTGTAQEIHSANEGMGWELFERKAFIRGKWKILRLPAPFSTGQWQLFDLEKDPGEMTDISSAFPAIRDSLINDWLQYAKANDVFDHRGHYDSLFINSLVKDH